MNGSGAAAPTSEIHEFVVGTGVRDLLGIGSVKPNSQVRSNANFDVLQLSFSANGCRRRFLPIAAGGFFDCGSASCHGLPGSAAVANAPFSALDEPQTHLLDANVGVSIPLYGAFTFANARISRTRAIDAHVQSIDSTSAQCVGSAAIRARSPAVRREESMHRSRPAE